ncbi:MAG: hypothetical protein U5L00_15865 [Desulfovermiculus sp.]|nr:hypothetical protein [Desulfovermiculus sp.]
MPAIKSTSFPAHQPPERRLYDGQWKIPAPAPSTCSLVGQETLAGDGEQAPEASARGRGGSEAVQKKIRCWFTQAASTGA